MFAENMTPGRNLASLASAVDDWRDDDQHAFDWEWYRRASKTYMSADSWTGTHIPGLSPMGRLKLLAHRMFALGKEGFDNIEFAVRDLSLADRAEIAWQVWSRTRDQGADALEAASKAAAMSAIPTHHQKMVLVDYEKANQAVGFIMGHNTLDPYWDKDDHRYQRLGSREGRNGFTPRQDISSRLTGPVLQCLQHNFAQAWQRETGKDLLTPRLLLADNLKPREGFGTKVMAQVLRTQTEEGKRDIRSMYLQAVNNATQYIYIENQYFRWKPLAEAITEVAKNHAAWGRDPGEHGNLHVFVVTNSSKEGMGDGALGTFRMLRQLGRPEVMPNVARLEQEDEHAARLKETKKKLDDARDRLAAYQARSASAERLAAPIGQVKLEIETLNSEYESMARNQSAERQTPISPIDMPGLKVHICTLVAPDSPAHDWQEVYIHSKLMIIDDVFTTLGSANINERSMTVDSELNVCTEDPAVARPLRRHLWGMHTGEEVLDDMGETYKNWGDLFKENKRRQFDYDGKKGQQPLSSLIEFFRTSPSRKNFD